MRLWLSEKNGKKRRRREPFVLDQIVKHAQLPRLLGRVIGQTRDGAKVYYRIEWIEQPPGHAMCPMIQDKYLERVDPLTALASMSD